MHLKPFSTFHLIAELCFFYSRVAYRPTARMLDFYYTLQYYMCITGIIYRTHVPISKLLTYTISLLRVFNNHFPLGSGVAHYKN